FDVTVDGAQVFDALNAGDPERAVDRTQVLDVGAVRHMDDIFDGDLDALVLRITCGDRHRAGFRVDVYGHQIALGVLVLGGLARTNFDFIAIPGRPIDGAVDVLQLEATARLERIGLIELLADGERRPGRNGRQ